MGPAMPSAAGMAFRTPPAPSRIPAPAARRGVIPHPLRVLLSPCPPHGVLGGACTPNLPLPSFLGKGKAERSLMAVLCSDEASRKVDEPKGAAAPWLLALPQARVSPGLPRLLGGLPGRGCSARGLRCSMLLPASSLAVGKSQSRRISPVSLTFLQPVTLPRQEAGPGETKAGAVPLTQAQAWAPQPCSPPLGAWPGHGRGQHLLPALAMPQFPALRHPGRALRRKCRGFIAHAFHTAALGQAGPWLQHQFGAGQTNTFTNWERKASQSVPKKPRGHKHEGG